MPARRSCGNERQEAGRLGREARSAASSQGGGRSGDGAPGGEEAQAEASWGTRPALRP